MAVPHRRKRGLTEERIYDRMGEEKGNDHMALGLKTIRTKGRVEKIPFVLDSGLLSLAQVEEQGAREGGTKPSPLQRISSRHRAIAKEVASGATTGKIAAMFGLTPSRVSVLKGDPAFRELVAFFRNRNDEMEEIFFVKERLTGLNIDSIEMLRTRMEEDPDGFENSELIRITQITSDRSGHAPKRVEEKNININLGDKLEAARLRAREVKQIESNVIEGEVLDE